MSSVHSTTSDTAARNHRHRPRHLAMVGSPVISHTLPGLEIIRELVARGHRVSYATDPSLAEVVTETGAEWVRYDSTLPALEHRWPDDPIAAMELFLDDSIHVLPQLRAHYDADPADLYLYDIGGYGGRLLAETQGRPLVQLSPTYVGWKGAEQESAALWELPGAAAYREKFTRWLAESGATTRDMDAFSGRPPRALAMIPRAMQPHAELTDAQAVSFVGPCLGPRTAQGAWQRPAAAERVVLVSMGSAYTRQPEFYRRCLTAFGERPGWHLVLQIGQYVDPAELGELPSNVEVHPWVPQLAILERADAFVTHAGMGGSGEGLATGTPMVAVPQGAEQFANADRLVELGVARRLDTADATASALWEAVTELLESPEVARRSALLQEQARAEGGARRAADLVEEMLD